MKQLKNINHSFDIAINDVGCTIRKGTKWTNVNIGEILELRNCAKGHYGDCNESCLMEGTGQVLGWWTGSFDMLPPNLLKIEHNNKARDFETLRQMMEIGYGTINNNDIITALIYIRIS